MNSFKNKLIKIVWFDKLTEKNSTCELSQWLFLLSKV